MPCFMLNVQVLVTLIKPSPRVYASHKRWSFPGHVCKRTIYTPEKTIWPQRWPGRRLYGRFDFLELYAFDNSFIVLSANHSQLPLIALLNTNALFLTTNSRSCKCLRSSRDQRPISLTEFDGLFLIVEP